MKTHMLSDYPPFVDESGKAGFRFIKELSGDVILVIFDWLGRTPVMSWLTRTVGPPLRSRLEQHSLAA
jgi:hypothetical protein